MNIHPRNSGAAFSLIEVMCALLILGVGLVGIVRGITTALSSSKESELQTAAALIAAGQIELLRADGYVFAGEDEGLCAEPLSQYRWKQSVTTTSIDGLFDVKVIVEHAATGQAIFDLQTLLFDPPLPTSSDTSRGNNSRSGNRRGDR